MANAILMASGLGTRMRPLTNTVPKPLIKVGLRPMIETVIEGLTRAKVERIIVVVGYLGEQFQYLEEKYDNVEIVYNNLYENVNNISSVYVARELLKQGDCYICEADLFVRDQSLFDLKPSNSCYYGKMILGHSEDWVFDLREDGSISRIGKVGDDQYNMCGIAYFEHEDAVKLYHAIEAEYGKPGYETLFWDEVVDRHISEFKLRVHPVGIEQIVEIDTVDELEVVRAKYMRESVCELKD